jgi:hypothetical protein
VEDLTHQTLEEISIDGEGSALLVQYAEEGQGGKIVMRFRVPSTRTSLPSLVSGYHKDGRLREREVAWAELPTRVKEDVSPWLETQRLFAESSGKEALRSFLMSMQEVLR